MSHRRCFGIGKGFDSMNNLIHVDQVLDDYVVQPSPRPSMFKGGSCRLHTFHNTDQSINTERRESLPCSRTMDTQASTQTSAYVATPLSWESHLEGWMMLCSVQWWEVLPAHHNWWLFVLFQKGNTAHVMPVLFNIYETWWDDVSLVQLTRVQVLYFVNRCNCRGLMYRRMVYATITIVCI